MMPRGALAACAALVTLGACAASPVPNGYHEVVLSVSDLAGWRDTLTDVTGWTVVHEGDVEPSWLKAYGARGGREVVLLNPGTNRGYVRLVNYDVASPRIIRSHAQSWETGGWFDFNVRVLDMATTSAQFEARGWQSTSDPVQFSFGPFVVSEWLARGPDGIVMAMIERIEPPLEGWPQLKRVSRPFNATQVVSDFAAARHFYETVLGFEVYLEHEGASKAEGPNVLGLPHNLATTVPRCVVIVHPDGKNEGSVELLAFDGVRGRDFAEHAVPTNLGIASLRFVVPSVADVRARLT
ncbi:MAG: VOC family protein, partial [Pseudomonadota bacterium]